jgi:DNA-binding Xre family transcriptional regulator
MAVMPVIPIRDAKGNMPTVDIGAGRVTLRVKRILEVGGHTIRQAAIATGLTEKTIARLLSGNADSIHLDTIARFCKAYRIRPGALFEYQPRGHRREGL